MRRKGTFQNEEIEIFVLGLKNDSEDNFMKGISVLYCVR